MPAHTVLAPPQVLETSVLPAHLLSYAPCPVFSLFHWITANQGQALGLLLHRGGHGALLHKYLLIRLLIDCWPQEAPLHSDPGVSAVARPSACRLHTVRV